MYNKVEPVSLESQSFKQLQELPVVDFPIEKNGSMFYSNLNIDVKQKALYESANGKNIARMFIKVNAQSLGNITVHFKDVLLDNNAYCLVYTQDHQIVAGPIYQKSINNNQFTIMNIPAAELILEVIYKNKNDFTMKLNEVSFESLVNLKEIKKKEKERNQLLSGDCDNLGVVEFNDNIIYKKRNDCDIPTGDSYEGCGWMGEHIYIKNDYKYIKNIHSINDIGYTDFNASRATCVLMFKSDPCELDSFPNDKRYFGKNGTLINMPLLNCEKSYVIASQHELGADVIDDTTLYDDAIVRLNWHYRFGNPEHLYNIDCNASESNFNLWRQAFDFDEVIDYEGIDLYARDYQHDFVIFEIECKLFYKEYHLGWTTQYEYDTYKNISDLSLPSNTEFNIKSFSDSVFVLGSKFGIMPKNIISSKAMYLKDFLIADTSETSNYFNQLGFSFQLGGFSGTSMFKKNYLNSNKDVILGVVTSPSTYNSFPSLRLKGLFKEYFTENIDYFRDASLNNIWAYFNANNIVPQLNSEFKYSYRYDENGTIDSLKGYEHFHWYESMENKEKCPSPVAPQNPCDFDIMQYVAFDEAGDSICVTINQIPNSKFPDPNNIPKGFRIYHDFGEQRTIEWESFQDTSSITFPINFCLSKCELLDLFSIGKDGLDIGIDFYDIDGNVYNNIGCDDINIHYDFPTFCEYFDVNIEKIDSNGLCCTYEIELSIDSLNLLDLQDCSVNPNIIKLLDSLYFESSMESAPIKISETDNLAFDTTNGVITFEYTTCANDSMPANSTFKFMVSNNGTVCEIDSIDFPYCSCLCPENVDDWITVTNNRDEEPCELGQCKISVNLDIPSLTDHCYNLYSVGESQAKFPIPPNGEIIINPNCLDRGSTRELTFRLFKHPGDQNPCQITKFLNCPLVAEEDICNIECDSLTSEWTYLNLEVGAPNCYYNCRIKIKSAYRLNICGPDTLREVQVLYFESFSNDPYNPDACATCHIDIADVYRTAVAKTIHDLAINSGLGDPFNIFTGHCDTNWRVSQNACWSDTIRLQQVGTIENPSPNFGVVPCKSGCCKVGVKVCRTSESIISLEVLEPWSSQDTCDNLKFYHNQRIEILDGMQTIIRDSSNCNNTCNEWLNNLDTVGYSGYKLIFEEVERIKFNENMNYSVLQTNDLIKLNIFSEKVYNNSHISISNLLGNIVKSQNIEVSNGENQFNIDISQLKSGYYVLFFKLDNTDYFTYKFIIVR